MLFTDDINLVYNRPINFEFVQQNTHPNLVTKI